MGVPKFYRWLSERYPCLSQVIKEHQIPEFDNLYLDMNGIIHPCSHPNDDDPLFRITEEEIFKNIFNYIEVLFRIIKPKKNFFMAVDGCAPRAKMNQQRSRRFRTAKEAENNIRKAQMKGQVLPKEERFDSNCITPGTEFMARLHNQLKYFVNKKISTDPMWQQCTVYLSGHDVPGEGEHKVMDFIRYCKSQPGYDPNTRHCLYGLDADLIMLGLTSHEPHFALLREEVRFGKQSKRIMKVEQQTFHLLHLSLLREYLEFDFSSVKSEISFKYDVERIIDDWILLGFFVGNDFVPNLPNFHINHDALPLLFKVYKEFLKTSNGYLHNGGYISLQQIKKFFQLLGKFDREKFEENYDDYKWLENKRVQSLLSEGTRGSPYKNNARSLNDSNPYAALSNARSELEDSTFVSPQKHGKGKSEVNQAVEDIDDGEMFELEFKQHKRHYYTDKFKLDVVTKEKVQEICHEYVRAIQWIAHYYFNGLQSWSWYYPYHYAPFISDVADWQSREFHFDIGEPFRPFEQLLAVLPAPSRKLLPTAFQHLMVMDTSKIIDFYPPDFRCDLNGKQQEWEAVVLIPFIDEKRLLEAMDADYERLTDEEKLRNQFGKCFKYNFNANINFVYRSSYPGVFEDVKRCQVECEDLDRKKFHLDVSQLKKGLMKGTKLDVYFPGFPTMKHLKHKSYLKKAGVRVFQYNSRSDNMIVKIIDEKPQRIEELAHQLVNKTAHVEWPYMVEAKVVSVSNDRVRYTWDEQSSEMKETLLTEQYEKVSKEMKTIAMHYMNKKGIHLGNVEVLVAAKLLLGERYVCGSHGTVKLQKEYAKEPTYYAGKTVVKNLAVEECSAMTYDTIDNLYPVGSVCFMLAPTHYACAGEVLEYDKELAKIRLSVKVPGEPGFEQLVKHYDEIRVQYLPEETIAKRLGISTNVLSRITGDFNIAGDQREKRVNIGLQLKYNKQKQEALGFARLVNEAWSYTPQTEDVVRQYMDKFPEVFEMLWKHRESYSSVHLSKNDGSAVLQRIKTFLRKLPSAKVQTVRCGGNILDNSVVEAVVKELKEWQMSDSMTKIVKLKVKPTLIFRPTEKFGKLSPDPDTTFFLLDRVVNVEIGITVPVGVRGTVVGILQVPINENDFYSPTETKYEVLFDETFLGAMPIRTFEDRGYFMNGYSLLNISYGERKDKHKKKEEATALMLLQERITHRQPHTSSKNTGGYQILSKSGNSSSSQSYRGRLGPNQDGGERSKESSYWLKDRYASAPNISSSTRDNRNNTPKQSKYQGHLNSGSSATKSNSEEDFLNTWKAFEKTEKSEEKTTEPENIDQVATNALHQLLQIKPAIPSSADAVQDITTALHENLQIKPSPSSPSPSAAPPLSQSSSSSPSSFRPRNQPISEVVTENIKLQALLSKLYPDKPHQQQTQHQQLQQLQQLQQQQYNRQLQQQRQRQQQQQQLFSIPQHPGILPSFSQASVLLEQVCLQNNLKKPDYLFTKAQQGVISLVSIDSELQFFGNPCRTESEAMESVAGIALDYLIPGQLVPSVIPNMPGMFHVMQSMPPQGVPIMLPSMFQPVQFVRSTNPRTSNQQQHLQQQQQQQRMKDHAKKETFQSNTPKQSKSSNVFVPHQVAVKNRPKDATALLKSNDSDEQITTSQADTELKELLGIAVSREGPSESTPVQQKFGQAMTEEEHLKKLIGINAGSETADQTSTPNNSFNEVMLKSLLGKNADISSVPSVIESESNLSDEEKLKSLIGMSPENSGVANEAENLFQMNSMAIHDIDFSLLDASNTSLNSSTSTKTSDLIDQSSSQISVTTSPKPTDLNTTGSATTPGSKTKKPILLAANFSGPKKK